MYLYLAYCKGFLDQLVSFNKIEQNIFLRPLETLGRRSEMPSHTTWHCPHTDYTDAPCWWAQNNRSRYYFRSRQVQA